MLSFEWEEKIGPGLLGEKTQFGWTQLIWLSHELGKMQIKSNFSREETEENPQAYMKTSLSTCG